MSTAADFGLFSDVYTSLDKTGLVLGRVREMPDSPKQVMLVQYDPAAGGDLQVGGAVSFKTAASKVVKKAAAHEYVVGTNDNAGATVAPGEYFYITVHGPCTILMAAGVLLGTLICALGATPGQLQPALLSGNPQDMIQANIQALLPSNAGGTTAAYIY